MAYCNIDDLKLIKKEKILIDLTGGSTVVVQTVIDAVIAKADGVIDGYLGQKYQVPITPVPAIINGLSIDLALNFLYGRNSNKEIPDDNKESYKRSIELLEKIVKGEISLGSSVSPISSSEGGVLVSHQYDEAVFKFEDILGGND